MPTPFNPPDQEEVQETTNPKIKLQPEICYFGSKTGENGTETFGISKQDRRSHMYVVGKTGMGKTTLLQNMILQDIYNGYGVCFVDPHGDSSEYILDRIPTHRQTDVIYLNPGDLEFPIGLNILENNSEPYLTASGLMAVFNKIWSGLWSARMEYILNNTLLALLETPGNTLLGVVKMLTDDTFRIKIVQKIKDPLVKNFWTQEFANFNVRYRQEAISPILNKVGQFLSSEIIRNILGQQKSSINFREIMDGQKILIVNLSKGKLGEDNSNLFGALVVAKLQIAAMSRVDLAEEDRKDFFVYVDEFQNFTNDSFATILSEARKYRLNLVLAHQYIAQLTESGNQKVKNAIFGNVGTLVCFRVGAQDSQELAREFSSTFSSASLINLEPRQIVLKLSQNLHVSRAFKAYTLPPIFSQLNGNSAIVTNLSRERFAKKRADVASTISKWFEGQPGKSKPAASKSKKGKKQSSAGNISHEQIEKVSFESSPNLSSSNSNPSQTESLTLKSEDIQYLKSKKNRFFIKPKK